MAATSIHWRVRRISCRTRPQAFGQMAVPTRRRIGTGNRRGVDK